MFSFFTLCHCTYCQSYRDGLFLLVINLSKDSEDSVQEGQLSASFSYALAWMHVLPAQKAMITVFLLSPKSVINSLVGMNYECPTRDIFTHSKRKNV